jgi:hypothetical protein
MCKSIHKKTFYTVAKLIEQNNQSDVQTTGLCFSFCLLFERESFCANKTVGQYLPTGKL